MEFLTQLWMPILLSAVLVFVASSVIHMAIPWHASDQKQLKDEEAVLDTLRSKSLEPGTYVFPYAGSMKEMGSPEMLEKLKAGPVGWMTVLPNGGWAIGKSLVWWVVYSIIVGAFAAYAGWYGLGEHNEYLAIFRVTGAAAILGYSIGHMHDSIWKGASWKATAKYMVDGLVYGLLTAGTFAWLWPEVQVPTLP